MLTWIKRSFITISFLALIITNVLTLTHAAFNAALSGLISAATGIQTVTEVLQTKIASKDKARRVAAKKFGKRLASRTKRVAATSIAAIPAESVPYLGISALIAGTSYELYEACQSIKDLDQMYLDMEMEEETPDDVLRSVCNPSLPDASEIGANLKEKASGWLSKLKDIV